jgi:hypothetical protein
MIMNVFFSACLSIDRPRVQHLVGEIGRCLGWLLRAGPEPSYSMPLTPLSLLSLPVT